jgi:predicted HicB family RNase H-like nuclease
MTIEIAPEIEARLIDHARKQGISVETLLERLVTDV